MPDHEDRGPDDDVAAGGGQRSQDSPSIRALLEEILLRTEAIESPRFDDIIGQIEIEHKTPDIPYVVFGVGSAGLGSWDVPDIRELQTKFRRTIMGILSENGHLHTDVVDPGVEDDLITLCVEAVNLIRVNEGETLLPVPYGVKCFSGTQVTAHDVIERFALDSVIGPIISWPDESFEVEHTLGVMIAPEEPF